MNKANKLIFLSGILFFIQSASYASDLRVNFNAGVEQYKWSEFSRGKKLLEELGNRYFFSLGSNNYSHVDNGFIYAQKIKLYNGDVTYDGANQSGTPVETTTTYTGLELDFKFGYRKTLGEIAFDILLGLNRDSWTRDLQSSFDKNGERVLGYKESYRVFSASVSTGPSWAKGIWLGGISIGAKLPVISDEKVAIENGGSSLNFNLEPNGRASSFVVVNNSFQINTKYSLMIDLLWDAYRFDRSDSVEVEFSDGVAIFHQPESHQDTVSIQVGINGIF